MSALAQRYAAALADAAMANGHDGAAWRKGLREFAKVAAESGELRNVMSTPAIGRDAKQAVIAKICEEMGLNHGLRNFLYVLIDHNRTGMLEEIREAFEAELNRRLGIAEAEVISARELSGEEKAQLKRSLERVTGKKIEASYRLDAGLIGGATVRIGSAIYDGSVREQLERLRAKLGTQ